MVAGTFLKIFILFALAAPVLFILGDLTEHMEDYIDRGLSLGDVGLAFVYQMPNFILWSLPIAGLVGAVFTIHGMTSHREIVAAKAGGISFHRLVAPIVILGFLLTGVAFALSEVVPMGNHRAAVILLETEGRRTWRAEFVYVDDKGRTVTVQRLNAEENTMTGVVMEWSGPSGSTQHLTAEIFRWDTISGWTGYNGYLRRISREGREDARRFESFRDRNFTVRPEDLLADPPDHSEMTYAEIGRRADLVRRSGGNPNKLLVRKEQRLALAAATLVIILFGTPLATTSQRGGAAFGIGLSLGSTILYLLLFKLTGAIGVSGMIQPLTAAWSTNVLFLLAGLILLDRVRT